MMKGRPCAGRPFIAGRGVHCALPPRHSTVPHTSNLVRERVLK